MKIDLHRHLGGSISPECVWNIIQKRGFGYLASSLEDVRAAMTFQNGEEKTFHRFLDKFRILDEIDWNENLINWSIKDVCDSLENENVDYCWLDFSINKYMSYGWHKAEAIRFIYDCFKEHRSHKVGLVLSLKYESLRETQRQYAKLIDDPKIAEILVGIDLVGDEAYFDSKFYAPIFKNWRSAGKMIRAHVGESQGIRNVREAIDDLRVTNVAHGFKCVNDEYIVKAAIDNDITFDLAITSNYITGVLPKTATHPIIQMMNKGLKVTIGSDDPVQLGVTLDDEFVRFAKIAKNVGKSDEEVTEMVKTLESNAVANMNKFMRVKNDFALK